MDKIDESILLYLAKDGRMRWQALGEKVHLTPQAVAVRVNKLVEEGVIGKFTITQPKIKQHFITVFMATTDYKGFENAILKQSIVTSLYKVSGEGCYHLIANCEDSDNLENLLNAILVFGKYKLASSIRQIK